MKDQQQKKKPTAPLKQSASIILFENPSCPKRLLMFKRIAKITFGNAVVFPGGACDKEDKEFTQKFIHSGKFQDYSKITAIRQLFEQTGILLLPKRDTNLIEKLKSQNITNKDVTYEFLCNLWKNHLHLIVPLIRFLTVQFISHKRFDTVFYTHHPEVVRINIANIHEQKLQEIESLESLKVSGQGQSYFWQSSQTVLQKCKNDQLSLVPPQLIILNCLKHISSFNQLQKLDPKACYQPILMNTNNMKTFTLFGDSDYNTDKLIEKEPQSESKRNFIGYFKEKINSSKDQKSNTKLRRFDLDIKGKQFLYKSQFVQKSILTFLQSSPQL